MDEKKSCASCSYFEMNLGKPRGEWYACSLHKVYIVDDSQAETCPDFWKIFTPKPERNEQVLRPCPFCGHEAKMEFREMDDPNDPNDASVTCSNFECEFGGWWVRPSVWNKRPVEDALGERVEKLESMVERMAKENKEQNATIDVLIKKHSSVQFVNKKLQEKIKRQAERITQLEALYREEIKTKKQEALRERAEKAEAMVERMIEAGNRLCELAEELDDLVDEFRAYPDLFSWRALVAEWKERE